MRTSSRARSAHAPGLALAGVLALPSALPGQVAELATACAGGAAELAGPCVEAALAVQAAQAVIGLGGSGGAELAGSSSTLGKRFDGRPRLGLGVRGGFVDGPVPATLGPAGGPAAQEGAFAPVLQATLAAGLFQGFSAAPTVGGILALDLLATFSFVDLPGDRGFSDPASGFGLGFRLGAFRESFTLPGVTLSATRRWLGDTRLAGDGGEDGTRADLDVTATSVRGTIGKGLAAVDLQAGAGWDRYRSEVELVVRPGGPGGPEGRARAGSFTSDRFLLYGGVGYTFLVYQLSAEAGYARGFDDVGGRAAGGFDPSSGSPFVRLGFRLTY